MAERGDSSRTNSKAGRRSGKSSGAAKSTRKRPAARKPKTAKKATRSPTKKATKKPTTRKAPKKPAKKATKSRTKAAAGRSSTAKKTPAKKTAPTKRTATKATAPRAKRRKPSARASRRKAAPPPPSERPTPPSVLPPGVHVAPEELETLAGPTVPRQLAQLGGGSTVEGRLSEINRNLSALLTDAEAADGDLAARRRAADALSEIAERLTPEDDSDEDGLLGTARELLSSDFYFSQWGRVAMRSRSEEVDDFGWDPTYDARVAPLFELLYRRWFRVELSGVEHVPAHGRAMLVANHSGTVPWDGVMLKTAVRLSHPREELRWLAEDFAFHMPFLGAFMNRIGAVRACQENAERLLSQEKLLAVFPEGIKGVSKLYRDRYKLQRFGRGGYVKLALRTGSPLLPVAIVGAEEANPMLFKVSRLVQSLGLPYLPVTPTFPLLGPLGLLPAPSRWRIVIGEPFDLADYEPDAADDAVTVSRLNDRVRSTIKDMLSRALTERGSAFF